MSETDNLRPEVRWALGQLSRLIGADNSDAIAVIRTRDELLRLANDNDALRAEVKRWEGRYLSAVQGRKDMRDALQESRAEVERLNKSIKWEENRASRIGTHAPDCWRWGPSHYECALREVERLRASHQWQPIETAPRDETAIR